MSDGKWRWTSHLGYLKAPGDPDCYVFVEMQLVLNIEGDTDRDVENEQRERLAAWLNHIAPDGVIPVVPTEQDTPNAN